MAKPQSVVIGGEEHTYPTKMEMMVDVGKRILASTEGKMTLRQLYYRFVALDLVENKRSQYQYLGDAIKDARLDGRIPWDAIEDRTRSTDAGDYDYVEPESRFGRQLNRLKNLPDYHHYPKWGYQPHYVEVWVEKEALAGVFADICEDLKVVSFPNRGYTSITLLKEAADRIRSKAELGKQPTILYFGDFDPSGQDIERNIKEKLNETFGVDVWVIRKALTREQIDEYELPPQPAKRTDARYDQFVAEHGDMAVELDALPPEELRSLIRDSVEEYFDEDVFKYSVCPEEAADRRDIEGMVDEVLVDGA